MALHRSAPGWYTDPADSGWQRYWDGTAWTMRRRAQSASSDGATTALPKRIADWFDTGTAAARFGKALVSLFVALGVIAGGGVAINIIVNGGPTKSAGGGTGEGRTFTKGTSGSSPTDSFSSALLQPCDLGDCNDNFGWVQTQLPSPSGSLPSCPTFPQHAARYENVALLNDTSTVKVNEDVWQVTDPNQAMSTYTNTAQNCTFMNSQGDDVAYQPDYSAGSYGDNSSIFSLGATNPDLPNATPTIVGYEALITKGDLVASVFVTPGESGLISESDLSAIFSAATRKLG
jgi:hypothetical protein